MSDAAADEIREDIEATRADLDEKIQQLTEKAHDAVDVRRHVARRPWVALGLATAAGFFLGGRRPAAQAPARRTAPRSVLEPPSLGGLLTEAALVVATYVAKRALRQRFETTDPAPGHPSSAPGRVRSIRERSSSSTRDADQLG